MSCSDDECSEFPTYGVAPHECYWKKKGGFEENELGTSTIEPFENWPDNFLAEIDESKPILKQVSWGLCGVYYCPACFNGMNESNTLWNKNKILNAIKLEPK